MRWLVVLLLVSLAGCTTAHDPVDSQRPTWEAGYAWSYVYDDRRVISEGENGDWDNVTTHDVGRRIVEVLNTTSHLILMEFSQGEDGDQREIRALRAKDLAPLAATYRGHTERCRDGDCVVEPGWLEVVSEAPRFIDFPLESGKTWRTVRDGHVTQGIVEAGAIVETKVGTVQAARILLETTPVDPEAKARALREEGERNGFTITRAEVEERTTWVLYYSDEYLNVVQSEMRQTHSIRVAGSDPDGAPFSFASEDTRILRENLDGARLVARPERPIDDLARYLTGHIDVRDPAGQAVSSGYDIAIEGTNATIDAATHPHLVYHAVIDGTLPEGDTLAWRLVDADGHTQAQAHGPRFDLNLTLPGRLTVELEAVRGGDVIASAGLPLIADWHANESRECGPVTVSNNPAPCPVIHVPVHPGIQELAIRLTASGPSAEAGGRLLLHDGAGASIEGVYEDGDYAIDLADFSSYTVGATAWELEFRPRAGVATTLAATVDLRYAPQ